MTWREDTAAFNPRVAKNEGPGTFRSQPDRGQAMSEHTPGPWSIQELYPDGKADFPDWQPRAIRSPQNVCLAVVGEVDRFESERVAANARLMGSAPDLLEALEELCAQVEDARNHGYDYEHTTRLSHELGRASAAIAKAVSQ